MRLLLVFVIHGVFKSAECVNGIIWDKKSGNFVPIFSVPSFAAVRQEILRESRKQETHNFKGRIVRFTYYELPNMIITEANGTKVSGVFGEVWNTLAEHLNFTLKPILSEYHTSGHMSPNGLYETGVLKTIQLNQTDVVPRLEARRSLRLRAAQFTVPLWKTNYRLYIQREVKFLSTWMLKLFSPRVWYSILLMYLLLTICGYVSQKAGIVLTRRDLNVKLNDHLFYNFSAIVGQNLSWECATKSASIVQFWLNMFSLLIKTAFSAVIINYICATTVTYPFQDLDSLVKDSSYHVLTISGSLPDILFKIQDPEHVEVVKLQRHSVAASMKELYSRGCSKEKQWAIYIPSDLKKANGMFGCRLNPTGRSLYQSFIVSGIAWNFTYKRTIDIGIMKMHEGGLMMRLKDRWLDSQNIEEEESTLGQIDLNEVYLIIRILTNGALIALLILVFENLTFYYNKRK